jgi:spore germination protein
MLTNNDKITVPQAITFLITTIIGTGILSLPGYAAKIANSDGWIVVVFGSIMILVGSLIIGILLRRYPQDTFVEYSQKIAGKLLAYIFCILLIVYFTVFASVIVRKFADVMNTFMFQKTPMEFLILTQLMLAVYLLRHGIEPTARISEILLPVMIIPVIAMYLIGIPKADFTELLPFLNTPVKTIAIGSFYTAFSLLGPEILLVIGPYIRSPEKAFRVVTVSVTAVAIIYIFIVVIVFATLGVEDTKLMLWPAMTIIRTIMAPGGIFERLDALALALWTIAAFTSINGYFFSAGLALAHLSGTREFKFYITIIFPWIYLFSTFSRNVLQTSQSSNILGIAGVILGMTVPAVLLIVDMIKRKGGKPA